MRRVRAANVETILNVALEDDTVFGKNWVVERGVKRVLSQKQRFHLGGRGYER